MGCRSETLTEAHYLQAFMVSDCFGPVRMCNINCRSCFGDLFQNLHVLHASVARPSRSDWVRNGSERVRTGPNMSTEVYYLQAFLCADGLRLVRPFNRNHGFHFPLVDPSLLGSIRSSCHVHRGLVGSSPLLLSESIFV